MACCIKSRGYSSAHQRENNKQKVRAFCHRCTTKSALMPTRSLFRTCRLRLRAKHQINKNSTEEQLRQRACQNQQLKILICILGIRRISSEQVQRTNRRLDYPQTGCRCTEWRWMRVCPRSQLQKQHNWTRTQLQKQHNWILRRLRCIIVLLWLNSSSEKYQLY